MKMRSLRSGGLVVVSIVLLAACRGSGSSAHFPERHRSVATPCAPSRPPGYTAPRRTAGGPASGGSCEADTDCTAGKNGRCSFPGHEMPTCSYDRCASDAECGAGKACDCSGSGNACVPANCHTDADCGGLGCSPTQGESCGNMMGVAGLYCHTKKDDCIDDVDCKKKDADGMCVYSPAASRWTCNYNTCVG